MDDEPVPNPVERALAGGHEIAQQVVGVAIADAERIVADHPPNFCPCTRSAV